MKQEWDQQIKNELGPMNTSPIDLPVEIPAAGHGQDIVSDH